MKCNFCEGVAHPATGCQYTLRMIACGPCTRRFWAWFEEHSNPRPIRNRCEVGGDVRLSRLAVALVSTICETKKARNRRCCQSLVTLRCTRPKPKAISFYSPGPG